MLESLHIENMAVIRKLDIDLTDGFTVITGETGAGKSVMIDSLKLLMGAKAERDIIRHGESSAEVSALFSGLSRPLLEALEEIGVFPDDEGYLSATRVFRDDGKSVCRINGRAVSLSSLRDAMQLLLHIHGQDDTSFLKQAGSELAILDAAAHNTAEKEAYKALYRKLTELRRRMDKLEMDESEKNRTIETLRYQIADIEEVSPIRGEEDTLFDEKLKLRNIEKISKQTGFAYRALRGAEKGNACYILDRAAQSLRAVADVMPEAEELASLLEEHLDAIESIAHEVRAISRFDGGDPTAALDKVETRMAAIAALTRKYGGSVDAVLSFLEDARKKLALLEGMEEEHGKCQKEYRALSLETASAAEALYKTRLAAAESLAGEIGEMLDALDMPRASFRVSLTPRKAGDAFVFTENGYEDAEFLISVNQGEPHVPVSKCASGGEMSRIMLAIKSVIARHDGMPTVIFDEVDSGVSGKTSRKIGYSLQKSSLGAQIICVTHSAQIASLADVHLFVFKHESEGRTEASVRALSREERIIELSRILGGIHVTEAQRKAAEDMLTEGNK